jgi:hypothetical protein|tara:strand:+ start:239 stop:535 length:297 start_codon:yes stop_codon:yes gene_type:complete
MIKLIRLVSGEEIIAELQNTPEELMEENCVHIKDAIILIPAGEGKIGFMPFMPYTEAKNGLELRIQDIMFMVDPIDALITQFKSARSGISLPSSKILS